MGQSSKVRPTRRPDGGLLDLEVAAYAEQGADPAEDAFISGCFNNEPVNSHGRMKGEFV